MTANKYPQPIKRIRDPKELFVAKLLWKNLKGRGEEWFKLNHAEHFKTLKEYKLI